MDSFRRGIFVFGVSLQVIAAVLVATIAMDGVVSPIPIWAKFSLGVMIILSALLCAIPFIPANDEMADQKLPERIFAVLYVLLNITGVALWWLWSAQVAALPQAIATLFAGCAAISAAFLAYRGAMAKVALDREHKEQDDARIRLARHLQAIRVCRATLRRLVELIGLLHRDEALTLGLARRYWYAHRPEPSEGLIDCLYKGAELDPEMLVQLHGLYSSLEYCQRLTGDYDRSEGADDEKQYETAILRDKEGWLNSDIHTLDHELRSALDRCRVIISLGRSIIGSEYLLGEERFNSLRDKFELSGDLPAVVPLKE